MIRIRTLVLAALFTLLAGGIWAGIYAYDKGFTKKWRHFVLEEFRERGIEADIDKITLDPFRGLVARDVRFYQDRERTRLLAAINHIMLDVDLGRLMRDEPFLRSIDISNADLALPLEPDNEDSPLIEISDVSARILMPEDRIEVSRAAGNFYGVRFNFRGTLLRPAPDPDESDDERREREREALERLAMMKERRYLVQRAIELLERFSFDPDSPPTLDIEFYGKTDALEDARARATLTGAQLGFGDYRIADLRVVADYSHRTLEVEELRASDLLGELDGYARFRSDQKEIPFSIRSSLDLHRLASEIFPDQPLGEVVFYEAPELDLEGRIILPRKLRAQNLAAAKEAAAAAPEPDSEPELAGPPIEASGRSGPDFIGPYEPLPEALGFSYDVLGRFACDRTTSRGVVFDGLTFEFSAQPGQFYVRNALLDHQSGTASFQAMMQPEVGLKWRSVVKLDPSVFAPFVRRNATRRFLSNISMDAHSSIHVESEGHGTSLRPSTWSSRSMIDARNFRFNDVPIQRLETELSVARRVQTHRNIRVEFAGGGAAAAESVNYNPRTRKAVVADGASDADPVTIAACFSPALAQALSRYRFADPPRVAVEGTVDISDDRADTDLEVAFSAISAARYSLFDTELAFVSPRGRLHILGQNVGISLAAQLAPGTALHGAEFRDGAEVTMRGWYQRRRQPKFNLETTFSALGPASWEFAGQKLPFEHAAGDFTVVGDSMSLRCGGRLFGGAVGAHVRFSDLGGSNSWSGSVTAADVSFRDLSAVYSSNSETEGNLTAQLSLAGAGGDPSAIRGEGDVRLTDGNVYSIPLFGPLSALMSAVLPNTGVGYSTARDASAVFGIADGVIEVPSFEALTAAFRLTSHGTIDFVNDDINLRARMNVRGVPGVVLYPVSKLFEYRCDGSLDDPTWRSVTMTSLTGNDPDADDAAGAERPGDEPPGADAPLPPARGSKPRIPSAGRPR